MATNKKPPMVKSGAKVNKQNRSPLINNQR